MSIMAKQMTLLEVKGLFEHWRQTRSSRRDKIPASLWRNAVSLKKNYPAAEIIKTLKLAGGDFMKNQKLYLPQLTKKGKPKQKFVQVKLEPSEHTFRPTIGTIELKRLDGVSMVIQVLTTEVSGIIKSFLGDSNVTNYCSK
jgi:hypothetical protein